MPLTMNLPRWTDKNYCGQKFRIIDGPDILSAFIDTTVSFQYREDPNLPQETMTVEVSITILSRENGLMLFISEQHEGYYSMSYREGFLIAR